MNKKELLELINNVDDGAPPSHLLLLLVSVLRELHVTTCSHIKKEYNDIDYVISSVFDIDPDLEVLTYVVSNGDVDPELITATKECFKNKDLTSLSKSLSKLMLNEDDSEFLLDYMVEAPAQFVATPTETIALFKAFNDKLIHFKSV